MTPPVHLTRWGEAGPTIVMVHGGAQGSSVGGERHFSRQRDLAARGFCVVVPDRPGHGRSPAPGRPDDAELDGEWIAGLLGDGAHLVGHSFGGACAVSAAARRPGAVRSLTLIEPAMFALVLRDARVRRFLARYLLARLLAFSAAARVQAIDRVMHIPPEIGGAKDPRELARMAAGMAALRLPSTASLTSGLAAVRRHHIPLLVVTGGWTPAFTAVGDEVAARGGGEHVIIESPHHFPQLVSDAFNDLVAASIERAGR